MIVCGINEYLNSPSCTEFFGTVGCVSGGNEMVWYDVDRVVDDELGMASRDIWSWPKYSLSYRLHTNLADLL